MKVILLENLKRIGSIGEVIDVKRGFARNYLIANKKALYASKENIKQVEKIKSDLSKKDDEIVRTIEEHREAQRQHGTLSGNLMSHKQILTGMSRIMMSYLQVVAIARSVPIKWPQEVISTLEVFAMVSAPSLSLVSV